LLSRRITAISVEIVKVFGFDCVQIVVGKTREQGNDLLGRGDVNGLGIE
jgi:hypothetical protein